MSAFITRNSAQSGAVVHPRRDVSGRWTRRRRTSAWRSLPATAKSSAAATLVIALLAAACARSDAREYPLRGQVREVDAARQEITIAHEDIPSFMPAMTMPFKVRDPRLLAERVPGDLVQATLVIEGTEAYLRSLEKVGDAPLPAPAAGTAPSTLLHPGEPVADVSLVDQTGERRRLSEWRGHALAVTFIYTRCPLPNFCPLMDRHFKAVQEDIRGDAALRDRIRLVSVSFDPDYDTPKVLAAHAGRVGADPDVWRFLTGSAEEVDRFASQFGVSVIRDDPREIGHNLRTAVIDPEGRLVALLRGNDWTPADLLAELKKAAHGG